MRRSVSPAVRQRRDGLHRAVEVERTVVALQQAQPAGDLEPVRVAPGLGEALAHLGDAGDGVGGGRTPRDPARSEPGEASHDPRVDGAAHPDRDAARLAAASASCASPRSGARGSRRRPAAHATASGTPRACGRAVGPAGRSRARRRRTPRAATRRRRRGRGDRPRARRGSRSILASTAGRRSAATRMLVPSRMRDVIPASTDNVVSGSSQWPSGPVGCLPPAWPPISGRPYSSSRSPNTTWSDTTSRSTPAWSATRAGVEQRLPGSGILRRVRRDPDRELDHAAEPTLRSSG